MIIILKGGLGNQMFQYAFGESLHRKRLEKVQYDRSITDRDDRRCFGLGVFGLNLQFTNGLGSQLSFNENPFCFNPNVYLAPVGTVYDGWWQTEKYFSDAKLVRSFFEPVWSVSSDTTKRVRDDIQKAGDSSVFIHIRRTDYIGQDAYHKNLGLDYYMKAELQLRRNYGNLKFWVFSDDPLWCHANLDKSFTIVDHNKPGGRLFGSTSPGKEHEDIWLMSICKHAVVANSSFSWWGAWLGDYQEGRTVIGPQKWFGPAAGLEEKDIIPERWVKL